MVFDPNTFADGALQRLMEGAHSLQMRVFRAVSRRSANQHSVWELRACIKGLTDAVDDLEQAEIDARLRTTTPRHPGADEGEAK